MGEGVSSFVKITKTENVYAYIVSAHVSKISFPYRLTYRKKKRYQKRYTIRHMRYMKRYTKRYTYRSTKRSTKRHMYTILLTVRHTYRKTILHTYRNTVRQMYRHTETICGTVYENDICDMRYVLRIGSRNYLRNCFKYSKIRIYEYKNIVSIAVSEETVSSSDTAISQILSYLAGYAGITGYAADSVEKKTGYIGNLRIRGRWRGTTDVSIMYRKTKKERTF